MSKRKVIKNLLAAAAAVAISLAPQAQAQSTAPSNFFTNHPANFPGSGTPTAGGIAGNRALSFTPNAAFSTLSNGDGETSDTAPAASIATTVHVRPYLYVTGVLGGEWDVDGWGDGQKTVTGQYLDVYHSDAVKMASDDWENPVAISGTANGHEIPMKYSGSAKNAANATIDVFAANNFAVSRLRQSTMGGFNNVVLRPDGPSTSATLGHAHFDLEFKLLPNEETYSGTYSMNPTLTFTNQ